MFGLVKQEIKTPWIVDNILTGINMVARKGQKIGEVESDLKTLQGMANALNSLQGREYVTIVISGKRYKVTRKGEEIKLSRMTEYVI